MSSGEPGGLRRGFCDEAWTMMRCLLSRSRWRPVDHHVSLASSLSLKKWDGVEHVGYPKKGASTKPQE